MWLICLFCGSEGLVGGAVSVEYDARVSSGMSVWVMCACHVGWTRVEDDVELLGSLRFGVFAGSSSVVLRVSILYMCVIRGLRHAVPCLGVLLVSPPCFVCVIEYQMEKI